MPYLDRDTNAVPYYRVDGTTGIPIPASSQGSANWATSQVSVGTTPTLIAAARSGRGSIKITNITGAQQVFVGPTAGVSLTNGDLIQASIGASVTVPASTAVYGIANTAAQTVAVSEVF